jgi:hypothetical protein
VILFWDTETFSETPIGSGTHRYAEDPFAEILIESWAIGVDIDLRVTPPEAE